MSAPPPPPPISGLKMPEFKPPPPSKERDALLKSIQKGTKLRKVKPSEMKRPKSPRSLYKDSGGSSSNEPKGFVPTGNPMLDEMQRRRLAKQQGGGFAGGINQAPVPQFPLKKAPPVPTAKKEPPSIPTKPSLGAPVRKPPPIPSKPSENNEQKSTPPSIPARRPPPSVPTKKPVPSPPNKKPPPPVPTKPSTQTSSTQQQPPVPPARRKPPPIPTSEKPKPPPVPSDKPSFTSENDEKFEVEGRFKFRTDLPPPPPFKGVKKVYRGQKKSTPAMTSTTPTKPVQYSKPAVPEKPAPPPPAKKPIMPPPSRKAPPPPPSQPKLNPDEILKKLDAKTSEYVAKAEFEKCIQIRDLKQKIQDAASNNSPELKSLLEEAEKLL